jgi:hypothetical protein
MVVEMAGYRSNSHRLSGWKSRFGVEAVMVEVLAAACLRTMERITFLNRCHRFQGIRLPARPLQSRQDDHRSGRAAAHKGSVALCSRCHRPARGYDQLAERLPALGDNRFPPNCHGHTPTGCTSPFASVTRGLFGRNASRGARASQLWHA